MNIRNLSLYFLLVFHFSTGLLSESLVRAQNTTNTLPVSAKLKIYVDCDWCDFSYIRHNINFVDFVRDREYSDVHLLITHQHTASGGQQFLLKFIGTRQFHGNDFDLTYVSDQSDTDEIRRRGMTQTIKLGLMPFIAKTDYAQHIKINFDSTTAILQNGESFDAWDNWIFNLELEGGISSDANRKSFEIQTATEADRVTDEWKFLNRLSYEFEEEKFEDNGEQIISNLREWEFRSRIIRSVTDRWSAGFFTYFLSTTYKNIQYSIDLAPAIEYNFFPWKESIQREITLAYYVGWKYYDYFEPTLFNKNEENLFYNSLRMEFNFIQPWGELDINIESRYYLNLRDKYSFRLYGHTSLRLSGGFSLYLGVEGEIIHDQVYLRKGEDSLEELLLRRRQLATDYEFSSYIGLRFTFGSIFNNTVNRRL